MNKLLGCLKQNINQCYLLLLLEIDGALNQTDTIYGNQRCKWISTVLFYSMLVVNDH